MLRFTNQKILAVMGAIVLGAVGWATKVKLDAAVGPAGLDRLTNALLAVVGDLVGNVAVTMAALAIGLIVGFLINGAARRLDIRFKSRERWPLPMIRHEVRSALLVMRWSPVRWVTADAQDDVRRLVDQLNMIGLRCPPAPDLDNADQRRKFAAYLAVIRSHLTEDGLPYAALCTEQFAIAGDPERVVVAPLLGPAPTVPSAIPQTPPDGVRPETSGIARPRRTARKGRRRS